MQTGFNLAAYVLGQVEAHPEKTALEVPGRETLSYADLDQAVRGTARGLTEAGARPGDRILLRLGNTPDFPIAYLGALAAGLVPAPTSAALTAPEVAGIIETLSPRLVLRAPEIACPDTVPQIGPAELAQMREAPAAPFQMGDPERPGYVIYTSGTSGHPRAVLHAHRAILARRMMFQGWYGLGPEDRLMHAGAFNWTYTLGTGLMDPWTAGATALIPPEGTAATDLPGLIARHAATIFAAAPGVYRQALRGQIPTLPHLRHGLSAGEKMPDVTRDAWEGATGTAIHEAFGMSECSTFISGAPDAPASPGTLGRPQPGRRVALLTPDGPAPTGEPGTIALHRSDPGLMLEYLDQPEETAARFSGDWFLTGDLGRADADGQITYLGRDDDMMNAGGVRVSPIEVEHVLNAFPGLTASAAVEVALNPATTVIAAFYTSPDPLDAAALSAYVETRLARYKQPRHYQRVDMLPTGANGKLLRRQLRETWKGP